MGNNIVKLRTTIFQKNYETNDKSCKWHFLGIRKGLIFSKPVISFKTKTSMRTGQ